MEIRRRVAEGAHPLIRAGGTTMWPGQSDVFMLRGRLQFGDGGQSAPFPSAVIVWGGEQALVTRLAAALIGAWHIPAGARSTREE